MTNLNIKRLFKEDINTFQPLIKALMNNNIEDEVLRERLHEMFKQNYECYGIHWNDKLVGVFGLWFAIRHYAGKTCEADHVYIDDNYRNKGIGKEVFAWIFEYAKSKGCETSELNSYVSNYPSHKFYMNQGYDILGYHFLKKL
ncbi:GNAT family N-acetyltransferase [Leeuwenhoekiella sp. A16]|uniref:GNAT family N-acetyltransferase n=1 Tax=unclassified Leeuwenhoekiella TaxID=2615029 RepID=UPI003A811B39